MTGLLLRWSLRRTVIVLTVPVLLGLGGLELWLTYHTALGAANAAYDRSLLGAIKSIDANVSTASGGVSVELPYTMLEFFEMTASGQVFFRVATENGLSEIGSYDMPPPPRPLPTRVPHFYDASYHGEKVRVGAYARELDLRLNDNPQRLVIQVAETLQSRQEFTRALVYRAIRRDALLLLIAAALLLLVLNLTLYPLTRLREHVRTRSPQDMTPLDASAVPVDVRPLVEAINLHMARNRERAEARQRFVDDASHQLRTPLATLRTQVDYALRESDPENVHGALLAVSRQLDDATHRTNQMLALARADAADPLSDRVDLAALAEQVTREMVLAAREKHIDLAFDALQRPLEVLGHAGLLREAMSNLLHNAVRFTPSAGTIVVAVRPAEGRAEFSVSDSGPGIPPDQLPRLGERFFRARNARVDGTGLGLAIARAVAERSGGRLQICNVEGGTGCIASLVLPLAFVEPADGTPAGTEIAAGSTAI